MCREVVIFGAEYFKYRHSHDLAWNINFLIGLQESFQKMYTFTPLPLWFLKYSLLKLNVRRRHEKLFFSEQNRSIFTDNDIL